MKQKTTNYLAHFGSSRVSLYGALSRLFFLPGLFFLLALLYIQYVIGIKPTLVYFGAAILLVFFIPAFYFWRQKRNVQKQAYTLWDTLTISQQQEVAEQVKRYRSKQRIKKTTSKKAKRKKKIKKSHRFTENSSTTEGETKTPKPVITVTLLYLFGSDFLCINTKKGVVFLPFDQIANVYWQVGRGRRKRMGPTDDFPSPPSDAVRGFIYFTTTDHKRYTLGPMQNITLFLTALQTKAPAVKCKYDKELLTLSPSEQEQDSTHKKTDAH